MGGACQKTWEKMMFVNIHIIYPLLIEAITILNIIYSLIM